MERSEAAEVEFTDLWSGPIGILDRVLPARTEAEVLVDRVIAEELATLREAFGLGAEYAVTRMESPRDRVMHRLECPSLEKYLDRGSQWSEHHRERLAADRSYRLPLPTLVTRESALGLTAVRSCKVCWPNVHGRDPRPLRRLKARGLRPHHVGHVLSTEDGDSLGTIVSSAIQIQQADLFDVKRDAVEVVTSSRTLRYSPSEHVFIWDLPTDEVAIERKMQLFERLGSGLSQAH
jgi:hypothetical protein